MQTEFTPSSFHLSALRSLSLSNHLYASCVWITPRHTRPNPPPSLLLLALSRNRVTLRTSSPSTSRAREKSRSNEADCLQEWGKAFSRQQRRITRIQCTENTYGVVGAKLLISSKDGVYIIRAEEIFHENSCSNCCCRCFYT